MRTYLKLAAATAVAVTSVGVFLSARADSEKLTAATNTAVAVGLRTARTGGCAAPLKDGSVLITGGRGANGLFAGAETFSAKKGSADVAPMAHPRADHACATLPDGRVLIAGGITTGGGSISSAEVFNPASGQWALVGAMSSARSGIAAATLPGGKVLIAGGDSNGVPSATLEIFDPATNRFSMAGQLSSPRKEHAAVSLADGKVLIAGGTNGAAPLDTIDVYDPKNGAVSPLAAKLSSKRQGLTATTLLDSRVYFAGGSNGAQELATAEIYNPKTGTITAAAPMGSARSGHTALRVPNNNSILIVGGNATGGQVTSMELYIPWQNKYRPFGAPGNSGGKAAANTQLAATTDSSVDAVVATLAAAESQVLMAGEEAVLPTLTTDKADYSPGETVQITGTGWSPDSEITFVLARDPKTLDDTTWTAIVDSSGNLSTTYLVQPEDANVTFILTATGGSGNTAQIQTVTFTDSVTSVTITSPTSGSPANITSLPSTITVNFSYVTSATGTTTAQADILGTSVTASKTVTPGSGTDSIVLNVPAGTANGNYNLKVTVTNSEGSGATNKNDNQNGAVVIAVPACTAPSITTQPLPATVTYGQPVQFVAAATGNPTPSVSWEKNTGSGWTPTGITTTTLSITTPTVADSGTLYRAVFSNSCSPGTATTNAVSLTVNKKAASVTPNAASKTYGDVDPALSGSLAGFLAGDNVTATYSRTAGETVASSPYTITATLSPAGVLGNYNITYNSANFTIDKKAASVTPNAASKTYGDADPTLTGTLSGFVAADNVTAAYSRAPGETVAGSPYTISATLSPAGVLGNYNITYNTANLTIIRKAASVTPNAASKTYGDSDPVLTGTLSGFVAADNVSATYSRTAGETVAGGPYTISATLSPVAVLANYDVTYNTASFTISKKTASVTPNPLSKTYGDSDPVLTGTLSGFLAADNVTAAYTRTAGETVAGGPYTISATLGPVGVLVNYNVTYDTANFTISKRTASVTPNAAAKTYGDPDPALSGTLAGFLAGDNVTATYSRTAGESAGTYSITATLGPVGVLGNYDITYNTAAFTINKRIVSVTPNAAAKTYGDPDPALSGTLAGFLAGDNVTAAYSRTAGESAGTYPITATLGPAGVLGNYDITYNTAAFTINKRIASVTPNAAAKTYGDPDPALSGTLAGFLAGDNVTAAYSRTVGEGAGTYPITATLSPAGVLGNYDITYNSAIFTINKKAASVTPNAATKMYGDADPVLTGTLSGFLSADNITATYTRMPGESVAGGPYTISATLSPIGVLGNYNVTYNTANFTITKRPASVTPNAASKMYGDADPAFTGSLSGFLAADNITAAYSRTTGESVAGSPYTITATLSPAGSLANYNVTYNTANFTITVRTISVIAAAKSKMYGNPDPVLTFTLGGYGLAPGDTLATAFTGALTRAPGETVAGSPYAITQGTLAANSNYSITSFTPAALTITVRTITVIADAKTKIFGNLDPPLTFTVAGYGLAPGDTTATVFTGALTRAPGETVAGSPYAITQGTLAANSNYSITGFTPAALSITAAATVTSLSVSDTTKQYSDLVTLTATVSPFTVGGQNAAVSVTFFVGTQNVGTYALTAGVAQAAVALLEPIPFGTAPTGQMAPGPHAVTAVFNTVNPNFAVVNPNAQTLTITKEDADVTYTGQYQVWTATPTATSVSVPLTATIRDITALGGVDTSGGDIRNARVTINVNGSASAACTNLTPALVNAADTKTGTVGCTVTLSTGSNTGTTYDVSYVVSNYYTGSSGEASVEVNVAQPGALGFITGGGYVVNSDSQGLYAGTAGAKSNFGFNVKNNKSGKNLQGNVNLIVRSGGKVYQFKSNAIDSLNTLTSSAGGTATFLSKCNVTDITNPLAPIALGGSKSLTLSLEDNGEPGSSDQIAISIYDGGTLLFSSKWDGARTVLRLLNGGNFAVR